MGCSSSPINQIAENKKAAGLLPERNEMSPHRPTRAAVEMLIQKISSRAESPRSALFCYTITL